MDGIGIESVVDFQPKPDGRTKRARLAKKLRAELEQYIGGSPSVTQRMLIDQAVALQVRLAAGASERTSAADFLALTGALTDLLRELRMECFPRTDIEFHTGQPTGAAA